MADLPEQADYVIVGAGSAGCVLAARLSEDPGVRVVLLEAGPRDWHPWVHIPAGFMKTLVSPRVNWLYRSEPSEGTAGRAIHAPRGKVLGGSSAINGHLYVRGQPMDYDGWAQMGNRGWSYADVLPYFRRSERKAGAADAGFRGADGPWRISDMDWPHPVCEAMIAAAEAIGIPRNPDYNGARQEGVGYYQRAIDGGRRQSAATAFLKPAMRRPNLTVVTGALAERVLLDGRRATGVAFRRGGRLHRVAAAREVVLAGGAINSPQLLQLSGIGPGALLREHGIEVAHALPGVGENLRDHYLVRVVARMKNAVSINQMARGWRLGLEVARYAVTRRGILSVSPSHVGIFARSRPELDVPDIQFTFTPASYAEGVQSRLDDYPGMTAAPWAMRTESRGHVRIRSADPAEHPVIQPNYLADPLDRQVTIAGMRLARRLFRSPQMAPFYDGETFPGDAVETDDEWLDFARQRGSTAFHPMGTCRMGTDPLAVVDPDLRVHGVAGLRVVDASVMPTMISANLNATTIMIAERASDLIRGRQPLARAEP